MKKRSVIFERGEIISAPFKFTEMDVFKPRPVLVLSSGHEFESTGAIIGAMITTASRSSWPFDVPIDRWADVGLTQPCTIRLKLSTIDKTIVRRRVGRIDESTLAQVIDNVAKVLT